MTADGIPYINVNTLASGKPLTQAIQFNDAAHAPIHYAIETLAPSSAGSTTYQVFVNPADAELFRATTADGQVIDYYGTKTSGGLATALTSIRVQSADGQQVTLIRFDSQGRPDQYVAPNGLVLNFDWSQAGLLEVRADADDGAQEVSATFPLPAQSSAATPALLARVAAAASPLAATSTATSLVNVVECGMPVDGATVSMLVIPTTDLGHPLQLPGVPTGVPGQYAVQIPVTPSGAGAVAQQIFDSIASVASTGCSTLNFLNNGVGGATTICPALAALAATNPATAPAAPAILEGCTIAFKTADFACTTLGIDKLTAALAGPLGSPIQ